MLQEDRHSCLAEINSCRGLARFLCQQKWDCPLSAIICRLVSFLHKNSYNPVVGCVKHTARNCAKHAGDCPLYRFWCVSRTLQKNTTSQNEK
jgi:hypothetical protein